MWIPIHELEDGRPDLDGPYINLDMAFSVDQVNGKHNERYYIVRFVDSYEAHVRVSSYAGKLITGGTNVRYRAAKAEKQRG